MKHDRIKATKISGQAVKYKYVIVSHSQTVLKKISPDSKRLKARVSQATIPALTGIKFQTV